MLTLSERLTLRAMSNAYKLLGQPTEPPDQPGYKTGWDKATASPIVSKNGAQIVVRSINNRAIGLQSPIAISAY